MYKVTWYPVSYLSEVQKTLIEQGRYCRYPNGNSSKMSNVFAFLCVSLRIL